ncbi:LysR family transcriptional regulator [soil metagenome]
MDTLLNLKAFLAVARMGSFSAAARELNVAPSVVTKRIGQIEWRMQAPLFTRTTRRVSLTPTGQRCLATAQRVVSDVEGLFADSSELARSMQGNIRLKVPASVAVFLVGPMLDSFMERFPLVTMDIVAINRQVNPIDEGFDLALTLIANSYHGVIDEPLCAMPRVLCASPHYLAARSEPTHPRDLLSHDLLNFSASTNNWDFHGESGVITIDGPHRLNCNDAQLILGAVLKGRGITALSAYMATPELERGALKQLLPDYPLAPLSLKALVPQGRAEIARVQALVDWLRTQLAGFGPQQRISS